MPYLIEIRDVAYNELQAIKSFHRSRIVDSIDQQLVQQPTLETKNRKPLTGLQPDFEHGDLIWELRVGVFRVYYDVDEELKKVVVRAVREKPPHTTTEQIT